MAKILNRFELAKELTTMITEAEDYLLLISPYFKLNDSLRGSLNQLKNRKDFELVIVYGKNEDDKRKSLSDEDLEFFKTFPNVEIRYHKRLHAKIYANESKCLITSLNLHDYSLKENIEVGILTKSRALDNLLGFAGAITNAFTEPLDLQAMDAAEYIIEKSTVEFKKDLVKEKSFFGLITKSVKSDISVNKSRMGFCIRTKTEIPFNIKRPYSNFAFESWNKYKNDSFKEKFCHACGKEHIATMARPLCLECFKNIGEQLKKF